MTIRQPFCPQYGSNQVLTAGAASASVAINPDSKQVRVVNTGANKGYFRIYNNADGTQAATTSDCPVAAGASVIVTKAGGQNALAHISAAGTTLEVMTGEGF